MLGIGVGVFEDDQAGDAAAVFRALLVTISARAFFPVAGYCYKEIDGSRVTPADAADDPVGEVVEWAAGGGSYLAPSDAARPLLKISGGLRYLQFDGADDVLTASVASTAQHACAAGRADGATFPNFAGFLTAAAPGAGGAILIGEVGLASWSLASDWSTYRLNGLGYSAPWPAPMGADGVMTVTKAAAVGLRSQVGNDRGLAARFLAGRWYGVVIAPAAVTDPDRGAVESYLAGLCGVTLP